MQKKKNFNWKGDNIKYSGIHFWLRRRYGRANLCENRENNILNFRCSNNSNHYDWALIKGKEYKRNRNNFMMLCHSCHLKYDKEKENLD